MPVRIADDHLALDRAFTSDEFARYQRLIEERKSWGYYQQIRIRDAAGKTLETPGSHPCLGVLPVIDRFGFPRNLGGKSVLDIGCNAGFYSVVSKLRGAKSVLGIDSQPHYIAQALLIKEILGVDVDFQQRDGHDLGESFGRFDVVINTGVIYHLQNPMDFLTRMGQMTRETMYLETEALTDPHLTEYAWFIEGEYCQDPSNWWIYGPRCVERMARAAGFARVEFQGFVWTPPKGTKTPEGYERQGRAAFVCHK